MSKEKGPIAINVYQDQVYYWCACGQSKNQPFCDGSHRGTGLNPLRYVALQDGRVYFCSCKKTANAPLCDGSHL